MAGNGEVEHSGGAERRAHPRVAVDLRARADLDGRDPRPVRILDFCVGGLFIQVEGQDGDFLVMAARQVSRGERLSITFQAEGDAGSPQTFAIPVAVARLFAGGMGVAFSPPEPGAVRALARVAERARAHSERPRSGAREFGGLTPDSARAAVVAVRSQLDRWLRTQLESLFKTACDELFEEARDANSNEIQSRCMDALKDVERAGPSVREGALNSIVRALDKLSLGPDESLAPNPMENSIGESLALVDTGSFDDWVTTKNIITRHEPKIRDDAYALSRRLSVITGREVDELSNPAGVQQIATSFNEAMQNLGLARRARESIYHAFESRLIAVLGELYEQLNGALVERGVLSTVKRPSHAAPRQSRPRREPRPDPGSQRGEHAQPGDAEQAYGESGHWQSPPPVEPPPGYVDSGRRQSAPPMEPPPGYADAGPWTATPPGEALPAGAAAAPPVAAPSYYVPAYQSPIQSAVPQVRMQHAYQAAHSLMGLRRAVSSGTSVRKPAQPAEMPAASGASPDLLGALNQLQSQPEWNVNPPSRQGLRLKERLCESLTREGVVLSDEEDQAVDVLTGIIEAIIGDPLIAQNVKPRIQRLSVPLLKVALKDQGFFMEDAHPARQVVNRLGMLGLPEALAAGEEGDSLSAAVDPLLTRIVDDAGADPAVFESVLPELDQIVQRQNARFGHNVESIVESRERQQQVLAQRRGGEPHAPRQVPSELAPWFRRTGRMKVGDMITFKANSDTPDSRTLAWVSDDSETFVFADHNGHQSAAVTQQELALEMFRGTAKVLGSPDVPAMDRGVYEMLHRIHRALVEDGQRDTVTGLMPLNAFQAQVDDAIGRTQRQGSKHALMALNLDGFAIINDKCGRKAGDSLLRKLSRLLQRQVAGHGCLTRSHADEFLVLLEDHPFQDAKRFAERQCRAIDNSRVAFHGEQYPITASIGLVPVTRAGESAEAVVEHARAALAAAKRRGGNQLRIYDPDEDTVPAPAARPEPPAPGVDAEHARARPGGANETSTLGGLLDVGRLVLRRQAVHAVAADSEDRPHFEVLVGIRGDDGTLSTVTRQQVQEAEQEGRMADVDRWVIRGALAWMSSNRRDIIKSGGFAINVSGATLADESLLAFVMDQLTESAVPPAKVIFEVTESVVIDRLSSAVDFIRTLREYGCRFSVDDFGAGHATFAHLKTLPVDYVKIDGMFVRDLAENDADFAMVKSINEIGHLLGKKTIAESVDSDAALERLRELNVDFAQGVAVAEVEELDIQASASSS